ncbi:MAG: phosphotransferase, partial [Actinomycetota bacterium]|nr:phosphotransferase [Actinomycetota bacterium]
MIDVLGIGPATVTTLKDLPSENASWLIETIDGERLVLRRHHGRATLDDLIYERDVLRHLDALGWVAPVPLSDLVHHDGRWFRLNRWVPANAVRGESVEQQRRRGRDLARLQVGLRDLDSQLGQWTGWQSQH